MKPWHPAGVEIKEACSEAVQYCVNNGVDIAHLAINYSVEFEQVCQKLVFSLHTPKIEEMS